MVFSKDQLERLDDLKRLKSDKIRKIQESERSLEEEVNLIRAQDGEIKKVIIR